MILQMVVIKLNEVLDKKKISLYRVKEDTGIAYTTLLKLFHNKNKTVDLKVLGKLCEYLGCDISDILAISKEPA